MLASDSIFYIQEFIQEKKALSRSPVKISSKVGAYSNGKGGNNNDRKLFHDTLRLLFHSGIKPSYCVPTSPNGINWLEVPKPVSVYGANLPIDRLDRKRIQLDNIIQPIIEIIEYLQHKKTNIRIVEFCAGSGSVALPLSFMYPSIKFVFIDNKERSLLIAQKRSKYAELQNTNFTLGNIEDYMDAFDIGVGLHACGNASDIIIQKCIAARAFLVVCPCCVGKVNLSNNKKPRSFVFEKIIGGINSSDDLYHNLIKAADIGHGGDADEGGVDSPDTRLRMLSKCYVEEAPTYSLTHSPTYPLTHSLTQDRRLFISENGYQAFLFKMNPVSCTPKNDILVGIPEEMPYIPMLEPIADIFDTSILLD